MKYRIVLVFTIYAWECVVSFLSGDVHVHVVVGAHQARDAAASQQRRHAPEVVLTEQHCHCHVALTASELVLVHLLGTHNHSINNTKNISSIKTFYCWILMRNCINISPCGKRVMNESIFWQFRVTARYIDRRCSMVFPYKESLFGVFNAKACVRRPIQNSRTSSMNVS